MEKVFVISCCRKNYKITFSDRIKDEVRVNKCDLNSLQNLEQSGDIPYNVILTDPERICDTNQYDRMEENAHDKEDNNFKEICELNSTNEKFIEQHFVDFSFEDYDWIEDETSSDFSEDECSSCDRKCARKHWNEMDELWDVKVGNFRKDINNIPCHVFGEHKDCAQYFCKEPKENEKNFVPEMKANGLFKKKIMDCFSRARLNATSLLINENTNIVEQLHSLFVKYNGGKRINFASSHSFGTRAKMGVLQYNTGRLHSTIFEATNQITNDLIKSMEFRRQCQNLNKKMKDVPYEDPTWIL